ncbi:hypothetical protein ACSBR2_039907 [Camellia fascicularis]
MRFRRGMIDGGSNRQFSANNSRWVETGSSLLFDLEKIPEVFVVESSSDNKDAHHVKTYEVALKDRDFVEGPWSQNNLDNGAGLLIPVPLHLCGVLIIGEETIVYYSASAFKVIAIRPELPWLLSCSLGLCHSLTYLAPIQKFWKLRGPVSCLLLDLSQLMLLLLFLMGSTMGLQTLYIYTAYSMVLVGWNCLFGVLTCCCPRIWSCYFVCCSRNLEVKSFNFSFFFKLKRIVSLDC